MLIVRADCEMPLLRAAGGVSGEMPALRPLERGRAGVSGEMPALRPVLRLPGRVLDDSSGSSDPGRRRLGRGAGPVVF